MPDVVLLRHLDVVQNRYDDEWRNREINNGRLVPWSLGSPHGIQSRGFCFICLGRFAMFAAIGIIAAENETGQASSKRLHVPVAVCRLRCRGTDLRHLIL